MNGPIALVGSGEFTSAMEATDLALLAAVGRPRPRVVILPTASWPDGEDVFAGWAARGEAHFGALGAEVESVLLRDRAGADDPGVSQAIGEADLIYLSGGRPSHLLDALSGTPAGSALLAASARGAVVAGCSAGAIVLAAVQMRVRAKRFLRVPLGWRRSLDLVPRSAVLPHYDAFPETLSAGAALMAPRGVRILGIDEETALVGRDGTWQVHGRGRVTVWSRHHRLRYRSGDVVTL